MSNFNTISENGAIDYLSGTIETLQDGLKNQDYDLDFSPLQEEQILFFTKALEMCKEFKQFKEAEEQGLLLRLPFGVGQTVYHIIQKCHDDSPFVYCDDPEANCATCKKSVYEIIEAKFTNIVELVNMMHLLGKTVFLSQSEAEKALESGEKNEVN